MTAMNTRTMPVVRALWVELDVWFVGLPDDTNHYVDGREAVERFVVQNAPGSALKFIGAPTPRSGADRSSEAKTKARAGEPQLRSEGPDTRREDVAPAGPSYPRTTNATRGLSNGLTRSRSNPSGISMKLRAEPLQSGHPSSLTPAPLGAPRRSAARSG